MLADNLSLWRRREGGGGVEGIKAELWSYASLLVTVACSSWDELLLELLTTVKVGSFYCNEVQNNVGVVCVQLRHKAHV